MFNEDDKIYNNIVRATVNLKTYSVQLRTIVDEVYLIENVAGFKTDSGLHSKILQN